MKRLLPSCFLASTILAADAAYRDEILTDQPVGYWRLGDAPGATSALNAGSLGAAGHGELINTVSFGSQGAIPSDADTAASFAGDQSKIQVPYAAELNPVTFTVEAWAKVSSDSSGHRAPIASRDDSPQKGFIFYCDPGNAWQFWTGTGEQVGWDVVGGATAEPDTWAHLVGTYDGTTKLFYVNGVLVGANQSRFTPNGARVLRIGASANESPVGDFFFVGDVDEVAVYGKALSPDRVLTHFKSGSGTDPVPDIAPVFAVQPAPAARFKGESISLVAVATGSLPITYQWRKNDADIPGATASRLELTNLQPGDSGTYSVVARNGGGELASDPMTLDVADVTKPIITTQPRNRTVLPGATASFSVVASGSTTFEYQWMFGTQNLANATNATLTLTNTQTLHLGSYKVMVKNPAGTTESAAATLQFPAPATQSYADTVKRDNPAGYWRLGEATGDVADDSVAANDGALLNGVTLGRPGALAGDADTAAGFASSSQTKIDVPWTDALNTPVFTVECWAKVTGGAGVHRSPLTSRADGPQRGYIFYAEPGNTWQFWIGTGDQSGWVSLPGPAVQLNTFAHLVGVYDGSTLSFYVNGILVAQRNNTLFGVNDSSPLRIGGGATEGDGNFFFEGDVDEVAVYGTALGEDRILAHYVAGFPLTTPPSITSEPISQAAPPGATVTFRVGASGGVPLQYQWQFNDQDIPGATGTSLVISNASAAQVGRYRAIVRNAGGSATSQPATLTVPDVPTQKYVDLVKAAGPVAYWRLGETSGEIADDEIGGNDGTYLDGVTLGAPGAISGDANTSVSLDRTVRQKVDVAWTEVLNPPVFTVEIWARVTGGAGNYRSPLTSRADGPQRGYIFYAEPGNTWQFWSGKGDSSGWDSVLGPAVANDKWTHLAASYDGTTKRFYVDGVLAGTSTAAFAPNDANPLRFGAGATEGFGDYFFQGEVDEPAVYDKVLSHEEIIRHFLAGSPPSQKPVLNVARSAANLVLTWNTGTLETTTAVPGTWSTVAEARSPWTVQPSASTGFYRLRQ